MATSLLPESAPFTEEQRAWLNGFFAGMLGVENPPTDMQLPVGLDSLPSEEEEEFPWHDSALPILDRVEMAKEKPLERKLMAAMAQLDCGACGYVCQTYGEALARGEESNLKLCSPGGKETSKMLKQLIKEGGQPANEGNGQGTKPAEDGWSRKNPFQAKLLESRALNGPGSAKDTRHVAIDLGDSGLHYDVGDALGVYPTNCPELVEHVSAATGFDLSEKVQVAGKEKRLSEALQEDVCLKEPSEELLELLAKKTDDAQMRAELEQLIDDDSELGDADVLDVLQRFQLSSITPQELLDALGEMTPRLYSIASSIRSHPGQVHLTVGKVTWQADDRIRKGVASTMFAERVEPGGPVRVFVQKSHGFTVPSDPSVPMIMVGPGTGIAPFMAFLQERQVSAASGKNWLFFGDQHAETDFLYREQLESYQQAGLLSRCDVAFSRDQEEKIYVQDRMREFGNEIWEWLDSGAHFYVCGDASRMAVDVDRALHDIVSQHGGLSDEEARQYVKSMAESKRYARDVY